MKNNYRNALDKIKLDDSVKNPSNHVWQLRLAWQL